MSHTPIPVLDARAWGYVAVAPLPMAAHTPMTPHKPSAAGPAACWHHPILHTTAAPAGFDISTSSRQRLFVFTLYTISLPLISHPWSAEGTSRSELTFRLCVRHLHCQRMMTLSWKMTFGPPNAPAVLAVTPVMVFALLEPAWQHISSSCSLSHHKLPKCLLEYLKNACGN